MFISRIAIKNFRLFSAEVEFVIEDVNSPDGISEGSGLNVFVGENGSGKSALLDAFSLPLLEYKTEKIEISDFNDANQRIEVSLYSKDFFKVDGIMPKSSFESRGFFFEAHVRTIGKSAYLSSMVVSDQKFIKVDSAKPKDGSPDLRVNVNNPFKGRRFNENDILFLDRNRLFQTRTGNFNTTRFDRLMEDFNYQYLKNLKSDVEDLNLDLNEKTKTGKVENSFLAEVIKKFESISGHQIRLDFLKNYEPFKGAFFATKKENNQQIPLSNLGSGYEMFFALLYSFYLAQQRGKHLIVFIDEPELHLHPSLQEKFSTFLFEFSKNAQIILTSHSSLLVKQLSENNKVKIRILESNGQRVSEIEERVLPYISANETNFLAFNLATEEYHNELYEELKFINGDDKRIMSFDQDFFVDLKKEPNAFPWKGKPNKVSEHTFIRNQIHHQKDNGRCDRNKLKASIKKMRSFF